jgi:hypothetical protein
MNSIGAFVPSERIGIAQRNRIAVWSAGFVCQHGTCLVALAMSKIEVSCAIQVTVLIYVVVVISCNDQEAEVSETTVCLKVLNIRENIIPIVRFSMVYVLEKFQLYGAAILGFCFEIFKRNPYINLSCKKPQCCLQRG